MSNQNPPDMTDLMNELIDESPLREVDPTSLDELFNRVNECLIAGAPHLIRANDDDLLRKMVAKFQTDALEWTQQQKDKPRRAPRKEGPDLKLLIEDL